MLIDGLRYDRSNLDNRITRNFGQWIDSFWPYYHATKERMTETNWFGIISYYFGLTFTIPTSFIFYKIFSNRGLGKWSRKLFKKEELKQFDWDRIKR